MTHPAPIDYVKAAGEAMGIPGLTPPNLRGTCATLLSLEGAQVKAIQKVLRHKDPRTTEIYIRPVMQSVRDAGARVAKRQVSRRERPPYCCKK